MRIIGLTGSIACGKSTVSAFLASRGFPVIDGDRLSRELTAPGSPVLQQIARVFGPDILYEDGTLNRRRLGRLVFSDPSARGALDDLMAPYLLDLTRRRIEEARSAGAELCFLDMPLLFEKGYDRLCDTVWTVWLPESLQVQRLMERDGYTAEEALSRIRAVLSSDEKASLSDRVIDNSGPVDRTYAVVSDLLAEELSRSRGTSARRRSRAADPAAAVPAPVPQAGPAYVQAPARQAAPAYAPAPVPQTAPAAFAPPVMERPAAAAKERKNRLARWRLPVWLRSSLIAVTVFLLLGTAALILMNAYLRGREEQHLAEQQHIDNHYPLLYRDLIEQYAAEYNLAPAFVASVIRNESSFQPDVESGVGARGLMQLMPDTAEWIAGKLKVQGYAFERMKDPESNIRFGCWYLNYLSRLYLGDPVAVTAAYHAGQGQVKVWLSDPALSENGYSLPLSSLPDGPTKNYAEKVTRDYGIYQEKYFSADLLSPDPGLDGLLPGGAGV